MLAAMNGHVAVVEALHPHSDIEKQNNRSVERHVGMVCMFVIVSVHVHEYVSVAVDVRGVVNDISHFCMFIYV